MCKQLNGPVLKSLKTKQSGPKSEKNAGLGPKFQFLFRALAGPEPKCSSLLRAGSDLGLKNLARADL